MPVTSEEVMESLKECYDPEIPVNIVDLGLIYEIRVTPEGQDVDVQMTMTSPGCPSHVEISAQVKQRVERISGVRQATVNIVWTPPWGPERLSDEARRKLGIET